MAYKKELNSELEEFLRTQYALLEQLCNDSDIVKIVKAPARTGQSRRFQIFFRAKGMVRESDGRVHTADLAVIEVAIPEDYLVNFEGLRCITLCEPQNIFVPNANGPFLCTGHLAPGTPLVDLVYQLYEIYIGYNKNVNEADALNWDACQFARQNPHLYPTDRRPLKRRRVQVQINSGTEGKSHDAA